MQNVLAGSARCKLFENIAIRVWNDIITAHAVGMDEEEKGITRKIIIDILTHHNNHVANFDVYAQPGWNESIYGSDIDVYVETNKGQYKWFALQAKLLKQGDSYDEFRHTSKHNKVMQWLKLKRLRKLSNGGCFPAYLLYNGKAGFKVNRQDVCGRDFDECQYGCSLVSLNAVERLATLRGKGKKSKWILVDPSFGDFHPVYAQPWRILVCCYQSTQGQILYSLNDIVQANRNYINLVDKGIDGAPPDAVVTDPVSSSNSIIRAISSRAGWNPVLSLVVHRTDNL